MPLLIAWAGLFLWLTPAMPAELCRAGIVDLYRFASWNDVRGYAWSEGEPARLTITWDGAWSGRNDLQVQVGAEQREAVERVLRERVPAAAPASVHAS